jgi:putative hydrolase of the HAD superfamily
MRLGALQQHCLFVGDNPVADILGAHAAGMQTAWFCGVLDWPIDAGANPGVTLRSLPEVLDVVRDARRTAQ